MKIGIFDSGLGGLFILKELRNQLRPPRLDGKSRLGNFDYVYLGDTKNLPYGNKSQAEIYSLTVKAINYLFKQDCALVIIACNTASSEALRKIQQEYLPKSKYKDRKVLGIIRPSVETVIRDSMTVGVIGTNSTIDSKAYVREFKKFNPKLKVYQQKTPLLVPMIENNNLKQLDNVLKRYLKPLIKNQIDTLILGCTHYAMIKNQVKKLLPKKVKVISQELILPGKLKFYLKRHKEIDKKISRNGRLSLLVTKDNLHYDQHAGAWFGKNAKLKLVKY